MAESNKNAEEQISAFSSLVQNGTYSEKFQHAPPARAFFQQVMTEVLRNFQSVGKTSLNVLDCGCGNGAWLGYLTELEGSEAITSLSGFDLTPDMVEVARSNLDKRSLPCSTSLAVGDILNEDAYKSGTAKNSCYDLIFTYDVVQQLPKNLQFTACQTIVEHLAEGGIAIIFDNDAKSPFGKMMARKKFITRYLHIPLVPRYYCNAKYPPLQQFADRLSESESLDVEIVVNENQMKRAMIIRKHPASKEV